MPIVLALEIGLLAEWVVAAVGAGVVVAAPLEIVGVGVWSVVSLGGGGGSGEGVEVRAVVGRVVGGVVCGRPRVVVGLIVGAVCDRVVGRVSVLVPVVRSPALVNRSLVKRSMSDATGSRRSENWDWMDVA